VHLRPEGNYLLARTLLPQVEAALSASGSLPVKRDDASDSIPFLADVRASLALTGWNELGMAEKILTLVQRPPFTQGSQSAAAIPPFSSMIRLSHIERAGLMQREVDTLRRYVSNDSMQSALAQYQAALEAHPDDPVLHRNLGEMFQACEYLPQAAEQYRMALQTLPHDTRTRQRLAKSLAEQHDYPGAIAEYQAALAYAPRSSEIHNGMANALAGAGEHQEAVKYYLKAMEGGIPLPEVRFNLSRSYIALGKYPEALAQLEEAVRLDPEFRPAQVELRRLQALGEGGTGAGNR
jgi:tetratricopeptide (TPR) repeat protein